MTRTCHLKCDECPAVFGRPLDGVPGYTDVLTLFEDAGAAGWVCIGDDHYCGDCLPPPQMASDLTWD